MGGVELPRGVKLERSRRFKLCCGSGPRRSLGLSFQSSASSDCEILRWPERICEKFPSNAESVVIGGVGVRAKSEEPLRACSSAPFDCFLSLRASAARARVVAQAQVERRFSPRLATVASTDARSSGASPQSSFRWRPNWKEIGDMKSDRTTPGELEVKRSSRGWRPSWARSERALRRAPTERASVEATVANLGLNRRSTWA